MNDELILPFERQLNTHSDVEALAMYLTKEVEVIKLSDALQNKLVRLQACRDIFYRNKLNRFKTLDEMVRLSWTTTKGEAYQISAPQAQRDFQETMELFNMTANVTGLNFFVEILIQNISETRSKAIADNDWRAAAACDKNLANALEKFMSNPEAEEYKKLQPPVIRTNYMPETTGVKLPENLEAHMKAFLKKKKKLSFEITDAVILNDEPTSDNATDPEQ